MVKNDWMENTMWEDDYLHRKKQEAKNAEISEKPLKKHKPVLILNGLVEQHNPVPVSDDYRKHLHSLFKDATNTSATLVTNGTESNSCSHSTAGSLKKPTNKGVVPHETVSKEYGSLKF